MSDPFKHVRPNEPVRIPAELWNSLLGASREVQGHRLDGGPGGGRGIESSRLGYGVVRVKNETGGPLPRYSVVGLDGPIFGPGDDLNAFSREVAFRGIVPDSEHVNGKFAVLVEPAAEDQIVRAFAAGVYQVRVDVTDEGHTCAAAESGNTDSLASAPTGPAQILWREGDDNPGYSTGVQWAVVRRAAGCPEEAGEPPLLWCCGFTTGDTLRVTFVEDFYFFTHSEFPFEEDYLYPTGTEVEMTYNPALLAYKDDGIGSPTCADVVPWEVFVQTTTSSHPDAGSTRLVMHKDVDDCVMYSEIEVQPDPEPSEPCKELAWAESEYHLVVVSCDPLLIDFYQGPSLKVAEITRA